MISPGSPESIADAVLGALADEIRSQGGPMREFNASLGRLHAVLIAGLTPVVQRLDATQAYLEALAVAVTDLEVKLGLRLDVPGEAATGYLGAL